MFWQKESRFYDFLRGYTIQKPWNEINTQEYDVIIVHPDYQQEFRVENPSAVYSLFELQYTCEMIYSNAGKLFAKGGLFEMKRSAGNDMSLAAFKQDFDRAVNHFTIDLLSEMLYKYTG